MLTQSKNVEPCEICGVVVSRKSDIPRHAKRHAPDSELVFFFVWHFILLLDMSFFFFSRLIGI